jgi:hypothetical protein
MATSKQNGRLYSFLRATLTLAAAFVLLSLTIGTPTPAEGGGTGWCTDYDGNNFPCYDDSSSGGSEYSSSGPCTAAHCGCLNPNSGYYDDTAYYSEPTYVGQYHSEHANVVWDGEYWAPESGYEWTSDDPNDYTVQPLYGTYHSTHPHVWWDGDGWTPESGYEWASDDSYDFTVQRTYGSAHPSESNVYWNGDAWSPADGYIWASDDPDDFSVVSATPDYGDTHPDEANVWWNGDAWSPADGYTWASDDPNDFSVTEVYVPSIGDPHPDSGNVVWNGDNWLPADGFTWLNDEAGDFRVVPIEEPEVETASTNTVPMLSQSVSRLSSLRINDVPSPAGYKSESERRAQLAALSDQHIEDQLAHIQRTMAAMGKDFRADAADLQAWYEDTKKAEEDALMANFSLLVGGALDDEFTGAWKNYAKIQKLAKDGMKALSAKGPVESLYKDYKNPQAQRDAASFIIGEITGLLADIDPEILSAAGTKSVGLASFFIDYTYQAAKWSISRDQILMITSNLDQPNGKLYAQRALSKLQVDLFEERARRMAAGGVAG